MTTTTIDQLKIEMDTIKDSEIGHMVKDKLDDFEVATVLSNLQDQEVSNDDVNVMSETVLAKFMVIESVADAKALRMLYMTEEEFKAMSVFFDTSLNFTKIIISGSISQTWQCFISLRSAFYANIYCKQNQFMTRYFPGVLAQHDADDIANTAEFNQAYQKFLSCMNDNTITNSKYLGMMYQKFRTRLLDGIILNYLSLEFDKHVVKTSRHSMAPTFGSDEKDSNTHIMVKTIMSIQHDIGVGNSVSLNSFGDKEAAAFAAISKDNKAAFDQQDNAILNNNFKEIEAEVMKGVVSFGQELNKFKTE